MTGARLGLALLLAASSALAQRPRITIDTTECAELGTAELRRVIAIELHAEVVDSADDPITHAELRCPSGTEVHLRVLDPVSGKEVMRTIDLAQTEVADRARTAALSLAELVTASWSEVAEPEPIVRPVEAQASPIEVAAVRSVIAEAARRPASPRLRFGVGPSIGAMIFTETPLPLFFSAIDFRFEYALLAVVADVAIDWGQLQRASGAVETWMISTAVGVGLGGREAPVRWLIALDGRLFCGGMRGLPAGPGVAGGAFQSCMLSPELRGELAVYVHPLIAPRLDVIAGYAPYGFVASVDGGLITARGVSVTASLGVSIDVP